MLADLLPRCSLVTVLAFARAYEIEHVVALGDHRPVGVGDGVRVRVGGGSVREVRVVVGGVTVHTADERIDVVVGDGVQGEDELLLAQTPGLDLALSVRIFNLFMSSFMLINRRTIRKGQRP